MRNGGKVSTPTRMARYVEPQTMYKAKRAARIGSQPGFLDAFIPEGSRRIGPLVPSPETSIDIKGLPRNERSIAGT
jgi:hypothetical protein